MAVNHDNSNCFPAAGKQIFTIYVLFSFFFNITSNNKSIFLNLTQRKYIRGDFGKQTILLRILYVQQRFFLHTEILY